MREVLAYVYEIGKKGPVAVLMEDGREISLDPWDVEAMEERDDGVYVHD